MKKNGFSFIETVVTVVILSTSLLLVYNSYSSIINNEQQRVYYNDPAYIYRTGTILEYLNHNTNLFDVMKKDFSQSNKLVQQIGINYSALFDNADYKTSFEQLINSFNINQIFVIKKELFTNCKLNNKDNNQLCKNASSDLNSTLKYVKTMSSVKNGSSEYDYYLVVEYSEMSSLDTNNKGSLVKCYFATDQKYGCHYYYASIPIEGVYLS